METLTDPKVASFYPKVWNLKRTVLKIHHKDFSEFSERIKLISNGSDNQEGFEKLFLLQLWPTTLYALFSESKLKIFLIFCMI